ncbi:hypothetical protein WJX72_007997 [[Myrmecia] bisecta]|uniref:PIN domain-containing protein n=1 Tax=[Myrmecia] bisecta TaxID=41462 RepID=A0AAW1R8V7_9CHLO
MRGVLECRQLLGQRSEQRGKGSALDAGRSAMQQLLDVTNLKGLDGLLSHPGAVLPPTVTCDRLAGETYVVLDTNVYIHRKHQKGLVFLRFVATHSHLGSTNEIFLVPDVVIHELQALGESERPVAAAAREAAQVLNAYRNSGLVHFQQPEERFVMQKGGNHVRPRPGDTGILDCIRYFQSQGATVKLCTYDRKFLVRAQRFAIPIVTVADLQTHLSNLLGKEKKGMMFDAKTGKIRLRHPDQAARLAAGEISQRLWDQSDSNMAVDGLSGSSSSRDEDQDGANAQCSSSDDGSDDGSDGEGPTAAADASAAPDDSPAVQVAPGMAGTSSGQGAVQTAGAFGEATHPSDQQQSAAVEHAKQRPAGGPGQPDPGLFVSEGWLALD